MSKELKLNLHTSSEAPKNSVEDFPQYLIITGTSFYYIALGKFKSDGKFDHFEAWKRGELVVIKPNEYKYWAELPGDFS